MIERLNRNNDRSAFTIRRPKLKPWHLALIGVMIAFSIFSSVYFGNEFFRNMVILAASALMVGLIYLIQNRSFDERTATEFQSLVFSGAMRSNTLLTVIIYRDGSIFYLDPRYPMNFAKAAPNHNLDQFLEVIGLQNQDKLHIYDAMKDMKKSEFEYVYKNGNKTQPLKIALYPIQRPEGFINLSVLEK